MTCVIYYFQLQYNWENRLKNCPQRNNKRWHELRAELPCCESFCETISPLCALTHCVRRSPGGFWIWHTRVRTVALADCGIVSLLIVRTSSPPDDTCRWDLKWLIVLRLLLVSRLGVRLHIIEGRTGELFKDLRLFFLVF